ncbi:Lrp/AsnC family transcriptional regulator [Aeromicrobium wangtongii]|uniref:Lrp/AsnC family transcriptional regulator n=1 Tax=Aeromicrobium wangtongii TaxID=2969247 RepID=A0ABY5M1G8_9ACTN|nr:Lrp/AsnC family transcriptional regulator [Aeromicrobium wangtongii]MCD9198005.1 Lrp/AsnC family transcriptional regulator [Aeromicrobium wangtongii]UUP12049.1 Lrp/AsnC family transcriptional regulator [Aeromicrobium wangtongii]
MDQLDVALVETMQAHPRIGDLELSRLTNVARATVQSRLAKLEAAGIITGYGPDIDLTAAGHPVLAFVTLEIVQGSLDAVTTELDSLPNVLEAYITSGSADVVCKIAAMSHEDLKDTLLHLSQSGSVARSTSVIVLSELVPPRVLPMLKKGAADGPSRSPAFTPR